MSLNVFDNIHREVKTMLSFLASFITASPCSSQFTRTQQWDNWLVMNTLAAV